MIHTTQTWEIGCGLELLDDLDKNSVTLMILDLPYFGVVKNGWDNQWRTLDDYLDWCEEWFVKSERVLKDNGALYYFNSQYTVLNTVNDLITSKTSLRFKQHITIDKGWQSACSHHGVNEAIRSYPSGTDFMNWYMFQDFTGSEMLSDKIASRNPFAKELKDVRLKEGITVKEIAELGGFYGNVNHGGSVTNWERGYNIPSKEQWGVLCEYLPSLKREHEDLRREYEDLRREYEDLRYPFNHQNNSYDVWHFNFYKERRHGHPTQKPFDLIKRIVLTSSNEGDLVCDPAMGTGTTMKVCETHNRNFVGTEIDPEYETAINERCMTHTPPLQYHFRRAEQETP